MLEVQFGGEDRLREKLIVEVAEFIGVKSVKARGKRLTTYQVAKIHELAPLLKEEAKNESADEEHNEQSEEDDKDQMSLF